MQPFQQASYLRNQRQFPYDDIKNLSNQMDQAYVDIASKVNRRIIGTFAVNSALPTGEQWFFQGEPKNQQSLRRIYNFSGAGNIPHGINWSSVSAISPKSYGTYTDGTNWYGAIYAGSVAIAGQFSFYVTPTNIVVVSGAGSPVITTGTINLEWISNY
jgi:hypothetical protein